MRSNFDPLSWHNRKKILHTMSNSDKEPSEDFPEPSSRDLDDLGRRLQQRQHGRFSRQSTQQRESKTSGMSTGLRYSADFVAGIFVGTGLGWLLDRFAGTMPWGVIVGTLLGFSAGAFNVVRAAKEMNADPPDDKRGEEKETT